MMPTLSAINIVRHKKEVMRICASHVHLCEQNASSDRQRGHRQRIKPKLEANQQTIVIATPMATTIKMAIELVALITTTVQYDKSGNKENNVRQNKLVLVL